VARLLKETLGIEAELEHGPYGQYKILVDDREVIDAGVMAALVIVPSNADLVDAVRKALANPA
jgi:hypothetical protein